MLTRLADVAGKEHFCEKKKFGWNRITIGCV